MAARGWLGAPGSGPRLARPGCCLAVIGGGSEVGGERREGQVAAGDWLPGGAAARGLAAGGGSVHRAVPGLSPELGQPLPS